VMFVCFYDLRFATGGFEGLALCGMRRGAND
jgi:hypothetical protein